METLVGIVTFGNSKFTKMTIESIRDTTENSISFFIVVGKPNDSETVKMLAEQAFKYGDLVWKEHDKNMGFPYSVNDLYDYAWKYNDYDNLIIAGNDIVPYAKTVDALINLSKTSDYEVISALQYDVRSLVSEYPDIAPFFGGGDYIFTLFGETPWDVYRPQDRFETPEIADMQMFDIQNLCLYKKSIMNTIGYTDVNFFPAYYIDNDYARRIVNAGTRCCTIVNARFFHFWSRTIKQESGGSNSHYFENNRNYYISKWGGDFGRETLLAPSLISSREGEEENIEGWRNI